MITIPEFNVRLAHPSDQNKIHATSGTPFWCFLWESSLIASQHIITEPPKKILDFGCGLGLTSLVASRHGHAVWSHDIYTEAYTWVESSSKLNEIKCPTFVQTLPITEKFDVVVLSDVLYWRSTMDEIIPIALDLLTDRGYIYIVQPIRDKENEDYMLSLLRSVDYHKYTTQNVVEYHSTHDWNLNQAYNSSKLFTVIKTHPRSLMDQGGSVLSS